MGCRRSHSLIWVIVVHLVGTGSGKHPEQSGEQFRTFLGWPSSECLKNWRAQWLLSRHERTFSPSEEAPSGPGQANPALSWKTPPCLMRVSQTQLPTLYPSILSVLVGGPGSLVSQCALPLRAQPSSFGMSARAESTATHVSQGERRKLLPCPLVQGTLSNPKTGATSGTGVSSLCEGPFLT